MGPLTFDPNTYFDSTDIGRVFDHDANDTMIVGNCSSIVSPRPWIVAIPSMSEGPDMGPIMINSTQGHPFCFINNGTGPVLGNLPLSACDVVVFAPPRV